METQIISAKQDHSYPDRSGRNPERWFGGFPTDTVYGLGVNVFNREAIGKLFIAKGRDFNQSHCSLGGQFGTIAYSCYGNSRICHAAGCPILARCTDNCGETV